jgi:hypothetical protein
MEENGILTVDQYKSRINLKAELLHILDEEELYWYKRSHATWLLKGDNNTEYFHRTANGKNESKLSSP